MIWAATYFVNKQPPADVYFPSIALPFVSFASAKFPIYVAWYVMFKFHNTIQTAAVIIPLNIHCCLRLLCQ